MPKERTEIFETMPIKKAAFRQILPAVFGQMIALIYSLADTYFVGRLGDPRQAAAIMVVSSPFVLLTAVSNLFGIGGAAAISNMLGKKQPIGAQKIASIVFWLGLMSGIFISLVFLLLGSHVLRLCGATDEIIKYASGYAMWAIVIGGTFNILSAIMANVVRAEGCSALAAVGVTVGGLLNILLDPFFVLPQFLGLGAVGAGMATALSNFVAASYFILLIIFRKNGVANIDISALKHIRTYIGTVMLAGFPSALQYALTVVAIAAQSRFTSIYGAEAVAALGIVKKLDHLPLYFSIGVSTGILPLLSYNHASGNKKRLHAAFRFGCAVSLAFSLICLIVYEFFAPMLTFAFISDKATATLAAAFLRRMVTAMPMMSISYPMIIRFQATGKAKESVICSLLRKGVIDIPLLFIADRIAPLYGLMWVQPIVDAVALAAACIFSTNIARKEKQNPT